MDDELLAHRELALEAAMHLGVVDGDRPLEHAVLGDLKHARVERGLDAAFHHERVAIADLDALDLDLRADDELRFLALVGRARTHLGPAAHHGLGGRRRCGRRRGRGVDGLILVLVLAELTFFAPAEEPVFL
jgi:hypothetical protein